MVIFVVCIVSILLEQKKLELHKMEWENQDLFNFIMSSEDTKILQFSQYQKAPFIIYLDLEYIFI